MQRSKCWKMCHFETENTLHLLVLSLPLTQCRAQNNQMEEGTQEQSVTAAEEGAKLLPLHGGWEWPRPLERVQGL